MSNGENCAPACVTSVNAEGKLEIELASNPEAWLAKPCPFDVRDLRSTATAPPVSRGGLFVLSSHPQLHTVTFSYLEPMFVVREMRLVSSEVGRVSEDWLVEQSIECAHPAGHVVLSPEGVRQLQKIFWAFNIFLADSFVARCPPAPKVEFVGYALQGEFDRVLALPAELVLAMMRSTNPGVQFRCVKALREVLSKEQAPIDEALGLGVLPDLVRIVDKTTAFPQLQTEAVWTLSNIASGTQGHAHAVVAAGAIDILIQGVCSPHPPLSEYCVQALGDIAGDSPPLRDKVLQANLVPLITTTLGGSSRPKSYVRCAVWTASNLMRGNPPPALDEVEPLVPTLIAHMQSKDDDVKADAFSGLSFINDKDVVTCHERGLLSAAFFGAIRDQLSDNLLAQPIHVLRPAVRLAGNIASASNTLTDRFINTGCLAPYVQCLQHPQHSIQKEVAWGLSNIMASSSFHIDAVVQTCCIPTVIALVYSASAQVAREALWVLENACAGGSSSTLKQLVTLGVVDAFIGGLGLRDNKARGVALKGLYYLLDNVMHESYFAEGYVFQPFKEPLLKALEPFLRHPEHGNRAIAICEYLDDC